MKLLLASLALLLAGGAVPAGAQADVAAFYRGKQLRMVVGSAAGGGYDLFARIVARHMINHVPGNPHIIVQNQPAAGGVVILTSFTPRVPRTAR
jgi:putative tricarboxylic transport membrane protein